MSADRYMRETVPAEGSKRVVIREDKDTLFPFLHLPAEIRNKIYRFVVSTRSIGKDEAPAGHEIRSSFQSLRIRTKSLASGYSNHPTHQRITPLLSLRSLELSLYKTCQQVKKEFEPIIWKHGTFLIEVHPTNVSSAMGSFAHLHYNPFSDMDEMYFNMIQHLELKIMKELSCGTWADGVNKVFADLCRTLVKFPSVKSIVVSWRDQGLGKETMEFQSGKCFDMFLDLWDYSQSQPAASVMVEDPLGNKGMTMSLEVFLYKLNGAFS